MDADYLAFSALAYIVAMINIYILKYKNDFA